jgi:hypothetical protein
MITSSEIKFPKFREYRLEYKQSQEEWLEVFNTALKPINQAGWEGWLQDPFFEGTPIFSRVNRQLKKGVIVNQILPSDDELKFRAYLDIFAPDSDIDLVEHVVITTTLSEESKNKARELIKAYLVHKRPKADMVQLCEDLTSGHVDAYQE